MIRQMEALMSRNPVPVITEGGPGPSGKGEGSKPKKTKRDASEERCGEDRGLGPKPKLKKVIIATISFWQC